MRSLRSGSNPSGEDSAPRAGLSDQVITVRTLVRVLSVLATVGAGGWLFLLDEVRAVRGEGQAQHFAVVREADESARFEAEQRGRLDDRVEGIQRDVTRLAVELGAVATEVRQIGKAVDAILSAVAGDGGAAGGEDRRAPPERRP